MGWIDISKCNSTRDINNFGPSGVLGVISLLPPPPSSLLPPHYDIFGRTGGVIPKVVLGF